MSAVILLPELYALGLTASSDISFPKTLTQYFSVVTVLNRQLANTEVCIGLEHLPNIYCGVAVFLLYPLYIFNRKISAREKIAKSVLLFVFIFAFSFNIPNFIWLPLPEFTSGKAVICLHLHTAHHVLRRIQGYEGL